MQRARETWPSRQSFAREVVFKLAEERRGGDERLGEIQSCFGLFSPESWFNEAQAVWNCRKLTNNCGFYHFSSMFRRNAIYHERIRQDQCSDFTDAKDWNPRVEVN